MSDLDLLLAIAGAVVTLLVVAGMVLITPRGQVEEAPIVEPETRVDGVANDLRPA